MFWLLWTIITSLQAAKLLYCFLMASQGCRKVFSLLLVVLEPWLEEVVLQPLLHPFLAWLTEPRQAGLHTGRWLVALAAVADVLCCHLAAMGLRPVLGRSLPCLTCETSFASRSREHQIKGVFSVLKHMEMVFCMRCTV